MITESLRKSLEHQHYNIVGNHSAVKVCSWTRRSIRDQGVCYKQKFYGIESHRCLQMTPNITCDQNCIFCWRVIEKTKSHVTEKTNEPSEIIDGCIEGHRKLISGYKGFDKTNILKWKESHNPTNAAISLLGEPLLYPNISRLIDEFHKRKINTFLVTNSQHPEILSNISEPRQLYISVDAPDRETYKKIDRPANSDFWERLLGSLETMSTFGSRKVLRLTMVDGLNMKNPKGYAKLIGLANPDFVEVKGYMWVGESRKRLTESAMPSHQRVKEFAEQIAMESGYSYRDEQVSSRVVLLSK